MVGSEGKVKSYAQTKNDRAPKSDDDDDDNDNTATAYRSNSDAHSITRTTHTHIYKCIAYVANPKNRDENYN